MSVHPDEKLLEELRDLQLSAVGRAKLRERIGVEHLSLSHIGHWQAESALATSARARTSLT